MLLIIGTFRVALERLHQARPVMANMVRASRQEAGCLEYAYAEDVCDPGLIHVTEVWRNQDDLDRHFASRHLRLWREAWAGLEITDRNLRLYEVGEPRPT